MCKAFKRRWLKACPTSVTSDQRRTSFEPASDQRLVLAGCGQRRQVDNGQRNNGRWALSTANMGRHLPHVKLNIFSRIFTKKNREKQPTVLSVNQSINQSINYDGDMNWTKLRADTWFWIQTFAAGHATSRSRKLLTKSNRFFVNWVRRAKRKPRALMWQAVALAPHQVPSVLFTSIYVTFSSGNGAFLVHDRLVASGCSPARELGARFALSLEDQSEWRPTDVRLISDRRPSGALRVRPAEGKHWPNVESAISNTLARRR